MKEKAVGIIALEVPPTYEGYDIECGEDGVKIFYKTKLPWSDMLIGAMKWFKELKGEYEIIGLAGDLNITDKPNGLKDSHLLIREKPIY